MYTLVLCIVSLYFVLLLISSLVLPVYAQPDSSVMTFGSYTLAIYRELCCEPTAPCGAVNLSHLLNPWPQLVGHNGGVLAVDVVIDGIMDVDVLALRMGGVRSVWCV